MKSSVWSAKFRKFRRIMDVSYFTQKIHARNELKSYKKAPYFNATYLRHKIEWATFNCEWISFTYVEDGNMSISITLLDQNFNVNDLDKVVFKPCSLSLPATAAWGDKNMVLIFFFILQISIFVFLKFLNLLFSKFLILCFLFRMELHVQPWSPWWWSPPPLSWNPPTYSVPCPRVQVRAVWSTPWPLTSFTLNLTWPSLRSQPLLWLWDCN